MFLYFVFFIENNCRKMNGKNVLYHYCKHSQYSPIPFILVSVVQNFRFFLLFLPAGRNSNICIASCPFLIYMINGKTCMMQIDVDIGSSAVARSVIGLVLGYVTSLVVDLAILIEVCPFVAFIIVLKKFPSDIYLCELLYCKCV